MAFPRSTRRPLSLGSLFCLIARCLVSAEVTESGLEIQYLNEVECSRTTKAGDNVIMHYNGTLEDGTEFDSSYKRNQPFQFKLGAGRVIEGWDEGLLDMCIQEERRLVIPPGLAYGNRNVGSIPAGSTLIFGTKLMGIVGVEDDSRILSTSEQISEAKPADAFDKPETGTETSPAAQASAISSADGSKASGTQTGSEEGQKECSLLGPFSLVIQGGLGLLAMLSVVWKRWRERPRRPLKIWFFDVSKQVFGSALLHIFNLLLSLLSSGAFEINASAQQAGAALKDEFGEAPNPCSYYLLNIAIDTTIGIPILVTILKILHIGLRRSALVQPPESIKSGFYGHPPRATWWLKQSMIYFVGLVLMKTCVFFIFQLLPWLSWVGDWALRWTEGNEALQISFVMFIFPVVMNAIQYYIIDSFIKDQSGSEYAPESADDAAEQYRPVRRDSLDSEDSDMAGQSSEDAETRKTPQSGARAKADAGEGGSDEDSLERRSRSAERPSSPEATK